MKTNRMSLIEMQNIAKKHGVSARKLCKMAGVPWQSFYRKRKNEGLVRFSEYDALTKAVAKITAGGQDGSPRKG